VETVAEKISSSTEAVKPVKVNPRFRYEVMDFPGGKTLKTCFQCGTCTSSCPVARFSCSYRPRQILQMAQLGLKEKVLSNETLWLCAACFTCTDRCPQGVEVASVLRTLRNMAVAEGFIPEAYKALASTVLETGYAYKITGLRLKKREELGLPSLPKANLEDTVKLAKITKFLKVAERGGKSSV